MTGGKFEPPMVGQPGCAAERGSASRPSVRRLATARTEP